MRISVVACLLFALLAGCSSTPKEALPINNPVPPGMTGNQAKNFKTMPPEIRQKLEAKGLLKPGPNETTR